VTKILEDLIPEDCLPFVDDIGIKRYIQSLDRTIERLERAGCTIGTKSQFCIEGIRIVGFVCGAEGRSPDSVKVIKILE
jgi:hypothetical protein